MSIFSNIPKARIQRASFDLSHDRKLSMNIGQLTPVFLQEVVPGDNFNIQTQSMVRFAPLIAPVMHRMNSSIHYFFVPNRIIMEDWEDFITGKEGVMIPTTGLKEKLETGYLADHLGLPIRTHFSPMDDTTEWVSLLPFRAYYQVWNDYYRDANIQEEIDIFDRDNNNAFLQQPLLYRAWEKDYFTSALPTPQRGVSANMGATINYSAETIAYDTAGSAISAGQTVNIGALKPVGLNVHNLKVSGGGGNINIENVDSVTIDVEELRRATKLQRFLERSMRAGNRYAEHLMAYWNVKPEDARLQRAEYLGGGRTPVVISDVANTTGTDDAPQGNLSGNALSIGSSNTASVNVKEHGYIIGIMSVIPESAYSQGIHRHWTRKLQLDYYFPDFAQLGEQPILNKEIFYGGNEEHNQLTFGYQSRYAEYKYAQSTVHGQFRNNLEFWHMARKFASCPNLSPEFITVNQIDSDPTDPWRIFAVTDTDSEQLWIQLHHNVRATRPMPFLNEPSIL